MSIQLRMVFFQRVFILLVLGLFLVPCFAEDNAPEKRGKETAFSPDSPPQKGIQSRRVFIPGDAVKISTFPDTASFLNNVFPIDDQGYVELPIRGKVRISNMSTEEFVRYIKQNFRDYLRYPNVQVKPLIRVSVLGGVATPGLYFYDPDHSLWGLIKICGGPLNEDGLEDMRWKRDGKDVKKNLIPILQSGASLRSIGFKSGDQIWVKSPGRPGFIEKLGRISTIVGLGTSMFALYFTYQFTAYRTRR